MKKLAIVAVALVLAMVFVGCSASSLLPGSTWDYIWSGTSLAGNSTRFVFEADGVLKTSDCTLVDGEVFYSTNNKEGEWTLDGDVLTIANHSLSYNGEWTITSINMKEMTWTNEAGAEVVFERAKN